jgi:hypothetical protein
LFTSDTIRSGFVVKLLNAGDGDSSMMIHVNATAPIPAATNAQESTTNAMANITIARVVEKQDPIKLDMAKRRRFNFGRSLDRDFVVDCVARSLVPVRVRASDDSNRISTASAVVGVWYVALCSPHEGA